MKVAERFSTDAALPSWIRFQHVTRYDWSREFVRDRTVLDAACGTGFGSRIMAEGGAARVVACDTSEHAVNEATERCSGLSNVTVRAGDVTQMPLPDASIDVYVCFETIEHVYDDKKVITEASRILAPGGVMLCSTPNRVLTNPGTALVDRPFNPHHVREYDRKEFKDLFEPEFSCVSILGQSMFSYRWQYILAATAQLNRMTAVRLHQCCKLANSPFDSMTRHRPQDIPPDMEPEFLIAVARK